MRQKYKRVHFTADVLGDGFGVGISLERWHDQGSQDKGVTCCTLHTGRPVPHPSDPPGDIPCGDGLLQVHGPARGAVGASAQEREGPGIRPGADAQGCTGRDTSNGG